MDFINHRLTQLISGLALSLITTTMLGCSEPERSELYIIKNIQGYSFDNNRQLFSFAAIAIQDGKVLDTGAASLIEKYPQAQLIDAQGKTLLPAIIDAHGHLSSLGHSLLSVDVRGAESAQKVAEDVAAYAADNPSLRWISGRGWNQVLWQEQQFPNAALLDAQFTDRPVWLERIDGHAGWANSRALELAGIDSHTASPAGGEILRHANGQPTGVLIDRAMDLLTPFIPPANQAEITAALNAATAQLVSLGITSVHDAGTTAAEHSLYKELALSGKMGIRIYAMISSTEPELEKILAAGPYNDKRDIYSARSIKIYADGALGSRGAAMLSPYTDRPDHSGLLLTSPQQLSGLFKLATAADFQVAIHAIGDRGNRLALDGIEQAYASVGGRHLRHRIEHAQVVSPTDIPRFKYLHVVPSMQPSHATSDMNMAKQRIGSERLQGAYAWRSFLDQGNRLVSGSDFPVELSNPFFGLHAAVTRQDRDGQPPHGWLPQQSITVEEALRSFTIDAAWAAHQEQTLGGLTRGKWADFILIDQNIFEVAPKELWKTKVLQTWLAGKPVYQAP